MNDAPRTTAAIEADLRDPPNNIRPLLTEAADRLAELDGENRRLWRRLDSALHVNHGTP